MELNEIARKHVAQSLAEMRDPEKLARWHDGTRAKEQAAEIVAAAVAEANQVILEQEQKNAG